MSVPSTLVVSISKEDNVSLFSQSQCTDMNSPIVYWPMIESSMGIMGACLPMLRPLFTGKSTI